MKLFKLIFLTTTLFFLVASNVYAKENVTETDKGTTPYFVGQWLPADQVFLDQWMAKLIAETKLTNKPLLPVIQEFKELIENDPELFMLFQQMFTQIPDRPEFSTNPVGNPQVKDYQHMLQLLNQVLTKAPEFNKTGLVGFPINAILNWPMGTPAGTAAFLNDKVNLQLRKILNKWSVFLSSADSRYVLSEDPVRGWFGRDAKQSLPDFATDFNCDPSLPYYGFKSWDDFFIRTFRKGKRPTASQDDESIIANSCESAPYRIARNVKLRDTFWIKTQPYSLQHMLAMDPLTVQFNGATVYQAFLSALSYHRWHSPVSGKIVKTRIIKGSYYAEALSEGFDPAGPNNSQAYITHIASRAIIFIEADNPEIGLFAVMFVGMGEVSSTEVTVYEGQHINKGEQLGMFHFGGSTHCLIFRPDVKVKFDLHGQTPGVHAGNIPVRAKIATITK